MDSFLAVPIVGLLIPPVHASMSGVGPDVALAWSVVEVSPLLGSLSLLVIGLSGFYIANSGALG